MKIEVENFWNVREEHLHVDCVGVVPYLVAELPFFNIMFALQNLTFLDLVN